MILDEAYKILDAEPTISSAMLKANYRFLVKLYHPDEPFPDNENFRKIIEAYNLITKTYE